jgi:hypothetical protein
MVLSRSRALVIGKQIKTPRPRCAPIRHPRTYSRDGRSLFETLLGTRASRFFVPTIPRIGTHDGTVSPHLGKNLSSCHRGGSSL